MGVSRGFKSFVQSANRGFKTWQVLQKRGHKFVKEHVKSMYNADVLARKAANMLQNASEYATMGSQLLNGRAGDTLRQAVANMGGSIQNFRRGELANRARQDFGGYNNNSIMNA